MIIELADEIALCTYYTGKYQGIRNNYGEKIIEEKKISFLGRQQLRDNLNFAKNRWKLNLYYVFMLDYTPDYYSSWRRNIWEAGGSKMYRVINGILWYFIFLEHRLMFSCKTGS